MRGITLIFGICAAASLVPVHAQDDAKHGIEGTAVSNPHIDIARVKPLDLTALAFRLGEGQVDLTRASDLSGPIGIGGAWQTPPYVALHSVHQMDRQKAMTVPGIGPISATASAALAPPAETFAKGRDFAAWLGLTPL